jgi:Pyruvate/2-oxoacid:ferredoxin oxidoreductase delta subunit
MAHYVSKLRSVKMKIKHINFNKDFCVDCKICSRNCPINIDVHSYKEEGKVLNEDCLKCNVCVEKCPRKALYFD